MNVILGEMVHRCMSGKTRIPYPAMPCDKRVCYRVRKSWARLKSLKGELAPRYDVREIGILGSIAREERDDVSDINLLVESGSDADLPPYIGLWQYLEDSFGIKIDLVSPGGFRREMRDAVMRDVVFI